MDNLLVKSAALVHRTSFEFSRYLFNKIHWDNRLLGIKGARGVGKTTLLLQRIKSLGLPARTAAYFSLDDLYFTEHKFSHTIEAFYKNGGKYVFLDEVHKYPGWSMEIKNLYDFYPDLHIVFTGSSIIDLAKQEGDLSRRVLMYELQGLSFREYLSFYGIAKAPLWTLEEICARPDGLQEFFPADFRPLAAFQDYLRIGYYPFFREDPAGYEQRLQQMVRTVIEYDMSEIKGFDPRNARKLLQLLFILANNVPYKPNLSQLSQKADIHRNTVLNYLLYLEQARLLLLMQPEGFGISLLQKPEKVYLQNPNLAFALSAQTPNVGNLRETFFACSVGAGHLLSVPKQGDFLVDGNRLFEIGGSQKSHHQIADIPDSYVVRDGIEYTAGNYIPLWAFGCLY